MTVNIMHKNKELTVKQLKAINLFASGMTQAEVSKELGISDEALRLWRKEERFLEYLNDTLKKVEDESIQHLRSLNLEASITIKELMGPKSPPGIRLKAAQSVIAMSGAHQRIQHLQDIQVGEAVDAKIMNHEMVLQIVAAIAEYANSQQIIDVGNSNVSSTIVEIPKEEKENEKPKN